jgi:hypothetical protein
MSIELETTGSDPQEQTDLERAWGHLEQRTPFEPDLAQRIQERAEQIRQETFRRLGYIDDATFRRLLRDDNEP